MRSSNWPLKLSIFVEKRRKMPFEWGVNDCCKLAGAWMQEMVGFDPTLEFTYHDSETAKMLLAQHGGIETMVSDICFRCGWLECSNLQMRRGHIGLTPTPVGQALGVCLGSQCIFPGLDGATFRPVDRVTRAWRIE